MPWMQKIKDVGLDEIRLKHPVSERYQRALANLRRILRDGKAIGVAKVSTGPSKDHEKWVIFDVVVWTEPLDDGDFGFYTVFEVDCDLKPEKAKDASIVCHYDGKRDRKKVDPGYKTEPEARQAMRAYYKDKSAGSFKEI